MKYINTYTIIVLCVAITCNLSAQWETPGDIVHSTSNPEIQKVNPKLILDNTSTGTAGIQFNNGVTIDATFGYNKTSDYFTFSGTNVDGLSLDGNLFVDDELAISQLSSTVLQFGEPFTGLLNYFPAKIAIGAQIFTGDLNIDGGASTELYLNATAENKITFDQGDNEGFIKAIGDTWEFRNTSDDGKFMFTKSTLQASTAEDAILTLDNTGKIGVSEDNPNGQMDICYNSTGASGTLELIESEDDDFSRIFFRNKQDLSKRWSLAGRLGSTEDHLFGLYYDGSPRLVYNENSSELEFDGFLDFNSGFNTAIRVDGDEAIWYNDGRFSWGFGGDYNFFDDEVRIGGSGTGAPSYQLEVVGNADISGELTAASDRRLKDDIKDIADALSIVKKIAPKSYSFRTDEFPDMDLAQGNKMGFIAQELEQVLPDLVRTGGEVSHVNGTKFNSKSVNYIELIPLLTKAIQEQQELITQQGKMLSQIKTELSQMADLIDRINRVDLGYEGQSRNALKQE